MDLEYYFIQYLFSVNSNLLKYENKELYKALFDRYKEEEKKIPPMENRLNELNKIFLNIIFKS